MTMILLTSDNFKFYKDLLIQAGFPYDENVKKEYSKRIGIEIDDLHAIINKYK